MQNNDSRKNKGEIVLTRDIYLQYEGNKYYSETIEGEKLFKLNDEVLKDSEGNLYNEKKFNEEIKTVVGNFVNKRFENIIILSGAGTSITDNGKKNLGKTMKDLAKEINKELKKEDSYFSIQEMAKKSNYHIKNISDKKFNLEDFISQVFKAKDFINSNDCKKYNDTINKIKDTIKYETSYTYDPKLLKHGILLNTLIEKITPPNKLTIATTNYDVMFEEAATENSFIVMDGFTFSSKPRFDSDNFEWNLVKSVNNINTQEFEYKKKVINLLKIHGSITWEMDDLNDRIYRKDKDEVDNPVMIFPSSEKYSNSYDNPFFELLSKFQELLYRPNTLLVTTGFSFSDRHINTMIERAIVHNRQITTLITDHDINKTSDEWHSLLKLMDSGYPMVFLKTNFNNLYEYFKSRGDNN